MAETIHSILPFLVYLRIVKGLIYLTIYIYSVFSYVVHFSPQFFLLPHLRLILFLTISPSSTSRSFDTVATAWDLALCPGQLAMPLPFQLPTECAVFLWAFQAQEQLSSTRETALGPLVPSHLAISQALLGTNDFQIYLLSEKNHLRQHSIRHLPTPTQMSRTISRISSLHNTFLPVSCPRDFYCLLPLRVDGMSPGYCPLLCSQTAPQV